MITKLYKKFIDKIIGEEQSPLHVFNCTTLVWISDIQSVQVMANEYKVYFDLSFCSGLQVRVLTYTDSRWVISGNYLLMQLDIPTYHCMSRN